jgi:hypothetical protein
MRFDAALDRYEEGELVTCRGPQFRLSLSFQARDAGSYSRMSGLPAAAREELQALFGEAFRRAQDIINRGLPPPARRAGDMVGAGTGQNP